MKTKPNFEKASVSLPPEVHNWLKTESDRRTAETGQKWSVSRIIQEALQEYRQRLTAGAYFKSSSDRIILNDSPFDPQNPSGDIAPNTLDPSVGGSNNRKTATYQKAGRARK